MGLFGGLFSGNPFKRVGKAIGKVGREISRPFGSSGFFHEMGDDLIGRNSSIGKAYRGIANMGGKAGDMMGIETQYTEGEQAKEAAQIAAARKAAHDAEVEQLSKGALGAVSLRRRRGSAALMPTGSPVTGSSPGSTGKTLLSQ